MASKQVVQRGIGAVVLAAVVLGSAGFATAHRVPASRNAAQAHANSGNGVLQYPNLDPGSDWPGTFDPADVTDSQSIMVINMLYGNLVKLDQNNKVIPDLAKSWSVSNGGKTYTFHLRTDAKFSDGKAITADDVIYSIDRSLNPKALNGKSPSPVAATYLGYIVGATSYKGKGDVSGLKKIDAHTVQITLTSPIAFFLQTLSYPTGDVVEKGTPIGGLITNNPQKNQVSSGPWKITGYSYKNSLTFEPNTGFYNYKHMKLKKVVMPFVGDLDTMYQGYESGQYDMTQVPGARNASAKSMPDYHFTPNLAIDYISYNFAKPPFNNKNLRLAATWAINRDLINDKIYHGLQKTIYSIVPEGIPGYDANGKGKVPGYDVAKAKMYLAKAKQQMGKNFPSSITINYQSGSADVAHEYTELQYEWKQIGLNVKLQSLDFNTWLGYVAKPSPSLTYTGGKPWIENLWIDDYPDAQDFTTNLLAPSSVYNIGNYDNPQFEKLITEALTAKGSERNQLYVKASRIALNDVAWSMIGQQARAFRWKSNIHGMAVWSATSNPYPANNDWTNVSVS